MSAIISDATGLERNRYWRLVVADGESRIILRVIARVVHKLIKIRICGFQLDFYPIINLLSLVHYDIRKRYLSVARFAIGVSIIGILHLVVVRMQHGHKIDRPLAVRILVIIPRNIYLNLDYTPIITLECVN